MATDSETKINRLKGSDTSEADWDDALLYEVAVDPFQQIAISGKEDGRAAGLRDGYLEGVNIGRSKGWEIGLELGYIHDFAEGILDGYQQRLENKKQQSQDETQNNKVVHRTSHRLERCLTLARDLVKMINEFPDPSSLLSHNREEGGIESNNSSTEESASESKKCCNDDSNQCTETSSGTSCCKSSLDAADPQSPKTIEQKKVSNPAIMLDVSTSLERIRAKFKLLCVLLKTKQSFELKKVLDLGNRGMGGAIDEEGSGDLMQEKIETISTGLKNTALANESNVVRHAKHDAQTKEQGGFESDW